MMPVTRVMGRAVGTRTEIVEDVGGIVVVLVIPAVKTTVGWITVVAIMVEETAAVETAAEMINCEGRSADERRDGLRAASGLRRFGVSRVFVWSSQL